MAVFISAILVYLVLLGRSIGTLPVFILMFPILWLLIIPHELGHAVVARYFGCSRIRIFIGYGKPVSIFSLFGFTWIINRIPMGGVTDSNFEPTAPRSQWILYILGGLIVNSSILLISWLLLRAETALVPHNILKATIAANLILIVLNLYPQTIQTAFGQIDNDGKCLFRTLFHWGEVAKPAPLSKENSTTSSVLKTIGLLLVVGSALASFIFAGHLYFSEWIRDAGNLRFALPSFFVFVGFYICWSGWGILKAKPARPGTEQSEVAAHWFEELLQKYPSAAPVSEIMSLRLIAASKFEEARDRSAALLAKYPNDRVLLVLHADALRFTQDYQSSEKVWDRFLAQIPIEDHAIYSGALAVKLLVLLLQDKSTEFRAEYARFSALPISDFARITAFDLIGTSFLMAHRPDTHGLAEFCVRAAVEIAPGTLTLQGTLGGILAERGAFDEAEPLLRACFNSPAMHDRGITSYYLALLAEHRGDPSTARKLARQSIALHPEPWLTKKAATLIERLPSDRPCNSAIKG